MTHMIVIVYQVAENRGNVMIKNDCFQSLPINIIGRLISLCRSENIAAELLPDICFR